ncbi:MAG: superoxide dismutase, Ni [Actinobacteria bacterium]|nr:superoxide dismutase, Ni [Actinomycetota bacterium]
MYDPSQAKIEALSVKAAMEKYAASSDPDFKSRAVAVKEVRSHQVKEHLWVLWTDYFKPNHFEAYPNLHTLFNEATKLAGATGTKGTNDVAVADKLLAKIEEISEIFWATKK